jgi:hypothetical protein
MSGETTVIPGKIHDESSGEKTDLAKINLVAKPSVKVNEQAITTRELADGSVTSDKLGADVLNQINAEAIIGDGSITCAKMASGGVCYSKRDTPWDDNYVQRDTIATTVGNYLRYVNTTGQTEEVTLSEILNDSSRLGQHAEYNTTAATAIVSTRIDYATKVKDDDTNVTTGGSWVYTVPETGMYSVSAQITITVATGNSAALAVTAGARTYRNETVAAANNINLSCPVSFTTYLTAAQTIYATGYGGNDPLTGDATENYITITRI